jgi:hypothetical protein
MMRLLEIVEGMAILLCGFGAVVLIPLGFFWLLGWALGAL